MYFPVSDTMFFHGNDRKLSRNFTEKRFRGLPIPPDCGTLSTGTLNGSEWNTVERISKENYYLDIAETVLERATCLRRVYGAIIVKNDEIISTGYNGAPRGRANCSTLGCCPREALRVPRGERYELCRSVHAEANAIISASRRDMVGGTLYLVGRDARTGQLLSDATSCMMCRRMVINAGLDKVIIRTTETEFVTVPVSEWVAEDDIPQ